MEDQIPESHLRPLTHLPPEQQKEVWKEAIDTAPDGKITAKHVEALVKKKRHPPVITPLAIDQVNNEVKRTFEAFLDAIIRAKRNHWEDAPKAAIKKLLDNLEGFLI